MMDLRVVGRVATVVPDRETARRHGWTHQVAWRDGSPCFVRVKSGRAAGAWANRLRAEGHEVVVIDLVH